MKEEEISPENYTADKPVSLETEDAFQRYGFAKRIAETIIEREHEDCIAIGIYGAWGEGKTSVLNFIETELKRKEKIVVIKFNPWRYTNEDDLLIQFFTILATALDVPLKTSKEKFGDVLKKYGKLLNVDIPIPYLGTTANIGGVIEETGGILGEVEIETLKERIGKTFKEIGKKVVVFIDDIDRLDKDEIYSIFRLIKLNADFSNSIYILSFDQEMVASAIGDRFGQGDKKSGESFLEKIIQVPLNIPKAQPDALKYFCFTLVDNAFNRNTILLEEKEVQRFVNQFTTNVLPRLDTPRLAVRYGNALSFAMPLLKGEVNMVDLMLIEALRVFFPEHYYFVKDNPEYFISSYRGFDSRVDDTKKNQINEHLKRLEGNLTERSKKQVKEFLTDLFPNLASAFGNYSVSHESDVNHYTQKRIASTKYFNRYFSYVVIKGDISDIDFDSFLNLVETVGSVSKVTDFIKEMLSKTSADNLIYKIRSREQDLSWEGSKLLIRALCNVSESLSSRNLFGFKMPFGETDILVYRLFKKYKATLDLFEFAKELVSVPKQFAFAYKINRYLTSKGEREGGTLFDEPQCLELESKLIERATSEAGIESIFEKFPEYASSLCHIWTKFDKVNCGKYIEAFINRAPKNVVTVIKTFVPTLQSTTKLEPYKGDLTKSRYGDLISLVDKDLLYNKITSTISSEELGKEDFYWLKSCNDKDFTDMNMIRQFLYQYRDDKGKQPITDGLPQTECTSGVDK